MDSKQVAIIALRAPDGSFMPSIPIHKKLPTEPTKTEEIAINDIAQLFAQRMKHYKNSCKKLDKNTSNKME